MPRSGLTYSATLELILAAVWAGYAPDTFTETLDLDWQARIVAAYRVQNQMEGIVGQERIKKLERERANTKR